MINLENFKENKLVEKIEKQVKENILKYDLIRKGEHIIVGLSGGPDSVCLFFVLKKLSEDVGFTLSAVHINHELRGEASDLDELFVKNLCEKEDVECLAKREDCKNFAKINKITEEEAGRTLRYRAFYEKAEEIYIKGQYDIKDYSQIKVAVAQNKNDQVETVFMRIMRGTGIKGLAGIKYKRKGKNGIEVIRPILNLTRAEIEQYLHLKNIDFRIDDTNSKAIYTRNKVRLELLPFIEENFNSNIGESICRLSELASIDNDYFKEEVSKVLKNARLYRDYATIEIKYLQDLHLAIKNRVIIELLNLVGLEQGVTELHIRDLIALLDSNNKSFVFEFPKNFVGAYSYGVLRFFNNKKLCDENRALEHEKNKYFIKEININEFEKGSQKDNAIYFDLDKIFGDLNFAERDKIKKLEVEIRIPRNDDYLSLGEGKGTKKIRDLFIDDKVFREMRKSIPIIAVGNIVLGIFSDKVTGNHTNMIKTRRNGKYNLDKNTKRILYIECLCDS